MNNEVIKMEHTQFEKELDEENKRQYYWHCFLLGDLQGMNNLRLRIEEQGGDINVLSKNQFGTASEN